MHTTLELTCIAYLFFNIMQLGTLDYSSSYFKYKTPILVWGESVHKMLKYLKIELKVNASSVESNLGRGNHRYLGLVLIDTKYALVSNT